MVDVRTEQVTVRVFNLEVAHAHTFFVGEEGVVAHNGYRQDYKEYLNQQGRGPLPSDYDAHHQIPQKYRNHPELVDRDLHHPSNIRGAPNRKNKICKSNVHQSITDRWEEWGRRNPGATGDQIEGFAQQIDKKYHRFFY